MVPISPWIQLPVAYVTKSDRRVPKRKSPVYIATCRRWRRQRSSIHKSLASRSAVSYQHNQFSRKTVRFLGLSRLGDDDRSFWTSPLHRDAVYKRPYISPSCFLKRESKFDRRSRSFVL